jgi:hypothetical protein
MNTGFRNGYLKENAGTSQNATYIKDKIGLGSLSAL